MKYKGLNKCNVFTHLNHSDTFDTKMKTQNDSTLPDQLGAICNLTTRWH